MRRGAAGGAAPPTSSEPLTARCSGIDARVGSAAPLVARYRIRMARSVPPGPSGEGGDPCSAETDRGRDNPAVSGEPLMIVLGFDSTRITRTTPARGHAEAPFGARWW